MADTEGKKLTELRVIDLKTELERRGLDKTGNKAALMDRLAKVGNYLGYVYLFSKMQKIPLISAYISEFFRVAHRVE